jgi:hypothetical protein
MRLGDAIYDFFSENQARLNDPSELAKIINPKVFPGMYN